MKAAAMARTRTIVATTRTGAKACVVWEMGIGRAEDVVAVVFERECGAVEREEESCMSCLRQLDACLQLSKWNQMPHTVFNCFSNPIKNPVPKILKRIPKVYRAMI